ncbi:hypothetical protein Riv7116_0995 [Rivularia sp. PCC 7116]|uniref:hypothetical protein n=1 Tax=Rivularia sp. PCC 7116 TaxID=373994 RepID=UPI00029F25FE|nr:hypothetical protein [Rivularia sp. PCC 7116]AFY53570.1 hypothetical protein Riv7116_0995 [Rivularia sp. PCC 7116]
MLNKLPNLIRPSLAGFTSLITYSFLGSCLTLIPIAPADAKTPNRPQKLAQTQYAQSEFDFNSQYNPNSESYLVIVDNTDSGLLERVRLVEPTAFAGDFIGRSVIQAGVFRRLDNAQERIRQLQAYSIGSRIYSRTTGREIANSYGGDFSNPGNVSDPIARNNNRSQKRIKYYYVAIPDKPDKLFQIENQIRQSAGGQSVGVAVKNAPRGPHVAVGPFAGRLQAEQWNYYIRSLGLNNARVYYGK